VTLQAEDTAVSIPIPAAAAVQRLTEVFDIGPRLAASDPSALSAALDHYWAPLNRYAIRLLGDADAAGDIAQEAFVRLWEGRTGLKALAVGPYLYRVAHNLAVDELRKRSVRGRWLNASDARLIPQFPAGPAELFEQRELRFAIDRAVHSLPERRREVFVLGYFHGLSYQQIAETVGISLATVKNHMAAALADLRAALRPSVTAANSPSD